MPFSSHFEKEPKKHPCSSKLPVTGKQNGWTGQTLHTIQACKHLQCPRQEETNKVNPCSSLPSVHQPVSYWQTKTKKCLTGNITNRGSDKSLNLRLNGQKNLVLPSRQFYLKNIQLPFMIWTAYSLLLCYTCNVKVLQYLLQDIFGHQAKRRTTLQYLHQVVQPLPCVTLYHAQTFPGYFWNLITGYGRIPL